MFAVTSPARFGHIDTGRRVKFSFRLVAVADLLAAAAAWARDEGSEPFVAQACIADQVSLDIGAYVPSGQPVTTTTEPWSGVRAVGPAV
jgi:hypothetical protein